MEVLLALTVAAGCIASFLTGAKVGMAAARGEEINLPRIRHSREPEKTAQESRMETILRNIEAYDGTPLGQETVDGGEETWI